MKKLSLIILIVFAVFTANAQVKRYIEARGNIDLLGNITISIIDPQPSKKGRDSIINRKTILELLNQSNDAVDVINALSALGWELVTAVRINKDSQGTPNSEFIVYYFGKKFQ
jgi:hypothetical protein